jgi:hypothetical protein
MERVLYTIESTECEPLDDEGNPIGSPTDALFNYWYMDCDEYRLSDIAGRELGNILGIALEDWIDEQGSSSVYIDDVEEAIPGEFNTESS